MSIDKHVLLKDFHFDKMVNVGDSKSDMLVDKFTKLIHSKTKCIPNQN